MPIDLTQHYSWCRKKRLVSPHILVVRLLVSTSSPIILSSPPNSSGMSRANTWGVVGFCWILFFMMFLFCHPVFYVYYAVFFNTMY